MHLNIQSLKPKIDILEIEAQPYDILIFTESWLSPATSNDDLLIPNFQTPFRCDRNDRIGGGVTIYIRDGLLAKHRDDLSVAGIEALWLEINFRHRVIIVGGIYRPPDSNNQQWLLLEQSIDQAFNQPCDNILVAENTDLNKATEDITHAILTAALQSIPNKTVTIRPNDIPWLNNTIRKAIRKRKKLHKTAKRLNTEQAWTMFKTIRNEVTKLIRISKQNYQNKLIEQVNSNTITAKLWFKTAKKLTNKTTAQTIPTLQDQNTQASTDQEKTELLNHFFCSQSTIDDTNEILPPCPSSTTATLTNILITPTDVSDAISLIDPSKACGPDLISPKLLREGFIKGDSTVNQLVYLHNDICNALDNGKEIRAVFCDVSKAFDRVWDRGLLHKLSSLGVKGLLLDWITSYLSTRKQRVVYANTFSSWSTINAGVPQGSILGPLLFLTYINDIVSNIGSKIRLFADDTSLYIIVDDPALASTTLNTDLETIHSWSKAWLVTFNPSKTESMIFSRKLYKPNHPQLNMNNIPITEVTEHKHLGLTFSSDLKWSSHISITLKKAWQRIGIMRSLKFLLNRQSLERMYFSFIRPILEYSDVVWDNCTEALKNEIEAVQNEAARIVTGATKLCNIQKLLFDLGWEPLTERRKKHRLVLFYKMVNGLSPAYLSSLIPENQHNINTRFNQRNIRNILCQSHSYKSSFLPKTINDWNLLPQHIKLSPSVNAFKSNLNKNLPKSNPLFNAGSRKGQILHARLRLGCSSLNYDLNRRGITNTARCDCGEIETVDHYLLHCRKYQNLRTDIFSNLQCALTLNNLLYGDEHLSYQHNISLFTDVQRFIISTNRFST
ncbi:uncharacterized protein LOC128556153 [Mercenaria mercenaria]|uniref:uncharacterized protein LOC128556153 n=1 Tax=Mercenaria mercenaria TaxID=6596 RepID=UPI00234FA87D|nr:uncharacterized protein LOC128556153 [Mercenaria mercenaria]